MHPDVLSRLRKEILDTVGSTRRPTYDDIKQMKYLRAFINGECLSSVSNSLFGDHESLLDLAVETLRLYPAV